MREIRNKSFALTNYLAQLLHTAKVDGFDYFTVITPNNAAERGAQLSVKLAPGLLDDVLLDLQANAVIVDERKPDVIRVAPAPLYNSYADVRNFVRIFSAACQRAARHEKWRDRHIELSS
jgi:kynureninase